MKDKWPKQITTELIEKKKIKMPTFLLPPGYKIIEYPQRATVIRIKDGWYISYDPIVLEMKVPDVLSSLKD